MSENVLLRLKNDPEFFAKLFFDFTPFPYQRELLTTKCDRIAACWGRQTGKTETISLKAVHFAFTHPGVLVLVVSPGIRQSMIMFRRIKDKIFNNPVLRACLARDTKTEVELKNGSRILALPCSEDGMTLRGYTADLVICDEASFMPEAVITSVIMPMLATTKTTRGTGILILISTPWGKNHIFYRCTLNPDYYSPHVKSDENPLIDKRFLENQRREIGEMRYKIEYEADFVDDATALFSQDLIRGMIEYGYYEERASKGQPDLLTDIEVFTHDGQYQGQYVFGLDLGKRRDYSVVSVFKMFHRTVAMDPTDYRATNRAGVPTQTIHPAWVLVYQKRFELKTAYRSVIEHVKTIYKKFPFIGGYIDQLGVGESVCEEIIKDCPLFEGVILHLIGKHDVMMWLYSMVEQRRIAIPNDRILIAEFAEQNYGFSSKQLKDISEIDSEEGIMKFWHPESRHDDMLWSCAMAIYATRQEGGGKVY
jgi:hypothetical protein